MSVSSVKSRDDDTKSRSFYFGRGGKKESANSLVPAGSLHSFETQLQEECPIVKLKGKTQLEPVQRLISLRPESRQILLGKVGSKLDQTDAVKGSSVRVRSNPKTVDVELVHEVSIMDAKLACQSMVDKCRASLNLLPQTSKLLVIFYGQQFVLDMLYCMFETAAKANLWLHGLRSLVADLNDSPYPLAVERWLRREFYRMDLSPAADGSEGMHIAIKDLKPFLRKIQCQLDSRQFRECINDYIGFDAFAAIYRSLVYVHPLFSSNFSMYLNDDDKIGFKDFARFMGQEQNDTRYSSEEVCVTFMREYLSKFDRMRDTLDPYFTRKEMLDYLFSKHNSIWDPTHDKVCQDMDQPLHRYWIASSHNTYLTGDQLKSASSLECYARALMMGCRCIELDCWDGVEEHEIHIFHGYTLTSKIQFPDVLKTIKEYAFLSSDYPVILSIEDNCSIPFQRMMAYYFREILGDLLLLAPVDPSAGQLPSPSALRRKIILKHKKLPKDTDVAPAGPAPVTGGPSTGSLFDDPGVDMLEHPDTRRRGVLHMYCPNRGVWSPHIFVLTAAQLYYSENTNSMLEGTGMDGADQSVITENDDEATYVGGAPDDLHVAEVWFHGKIKREDAVRYLRKNTLLVNGLFLVRESGTFPGDYTVSFLYNGQIHHSRIKTTQVGGERKFFLTEGCQANSLYELIGKYQTTPLKTAKFSTLLKTPCPQPSPHESEPWFAGAIKKNEAEALLNKYPVDGAFLIRNSESVQQSFTLSLRVDGSIRHCRLKQDGRLFVLARDQFENLNQLVSYYSRHPVHRGVTLKYPINKNVNTDEYYSVNGEAEAAGCYMVLNNNMKARALYSYTAVDQHELSFPANAVLTVVAKESDQWWRAEYRGRTGLIPANCVVDLNPNDPSLAGIVDSSPLGQLDVARCKAEESAPDPLYGDCLGSPYQLVIYSQDPHSISHTQIASEAAAKRMERQRHESQLRIASELSDLVVYCQAVPFNKNNIPGDCCEMCSFSEVKLDKLVDLGLVKFNQYQISRVFPAGSRVGSRNFNPMPMWNAGCHMVALNYQTPDKPMQLNQGRFMANGQCGYVLKPDLMNNEDFSPLDSAAGIVTRPITLTIRMIAGRNLARRDKSKGTVSPYVEVEICGFDADNQTKKTASVDYNGLNPVWDKTFEFNVQCPEIALLRFLVQDEDFLGSDPFIGQYVLPLDCIRCGFRSVPLKNQYSEPLGLSSLLIHVDKRSQNPDEISYVSTMSKTPLAVPPATPTTNGDVSADRVASHPADLHRIIKAKASVEPTSDLDRRRKGIKKLAFWNK